MPLNNTAVQTALYRDSQSVAARQDHARSVLGGWRRLLVSRLRGIARRLRYRPERRYMRGANRLGQGIAGATR